MDIKQSFFSNIYVIASICALSGFLFGFDTGVIAGALIFIKKSFAISLWQQQLVVSSCILGAFIGALSSGQLADHYGRRFILIQTAIAFIVGTIIASTANNILMIIVGRFILGLAIGVSSYTAPLYVSELSPKKIRGKLITINILAITAGEMVAHYINYVFIPYESWRLMFITGLLPAVLLFIFMLFLPESPRFYILHNKLNKAKKILDKLSIDFDISDYIKDAFLQNKENKLNYRDKSYKEKTINLFNKYKILLNNKYKNIFLIGVFLGVMQQAVGINTIMYYGPILFAESGFESIETQILATFMLATVNLVFTLVTLLLIDYLGRRFLLILGTSIASVSMIVSSFVLSYLQTEYTAILVLISLIFFVIGYALSLGAIFWVFISEVYPLKIRSTAMSVITAIQWLSNFIIASTFLSLIDFIGLEYVFIVYGILGAVASYVCIKYIPETKNIDLEIIEKNIESGKPLRYVGIT